MTFSVLTVADDRVKVVGTIWAAAEPEAQAIATSLFDANQSGPNDRPVMVRRTEDREIPLRLLN